MIFINVPGIIVFLLLVAAPWFYENDIWRGAMISSVLMWAFYKWWVWFFDLNKQYGRRKRKKSRKQKV